MKKILLFLVSITFASNLYAENSLVNDNVYAQKAEKKAEKKKEDSDFETYRMLKLFGDVLKKTKEDYVEEVTDKQLIEAALNGMLASLDPHSGYLTLKDWEDMQVTTKGEFGGLGIEVTMEGGLVKVIS